ncbi:MAG TPA: cytochrome P450 [Solirubrobacteraceae bacterium]|nr:cytochrome P450 [Solirubrobacteraceae bacterium]
MGRMTSAPGKEVRTGAAARARRAATRAGGGAAPGLPAGPSAPALWQTLAWMSRPGAFLHGVHRRFGDPTTIRTYWTEEPMVLFSGPDAVREVFALPAEVAPAGQSWEFLRPFAGPHSILVIDGEEHLRERRLLQKPFHGEQMRALAPMIGELARTEFATWRGPVNALERMRALTLEIMLRVVFGARDEHEFAQLHAAVEGALAGVRSLPRVLAMAVVMKDLGPWSPWGRFRIAVERFDALLYDLLAQRRAEPDAAAGASVLSLLLDQRDEDGNPPTDQHLRDQLVALLMGGHDSSAASLAWAFERLARTPAVHARLREGEPAYVEAVVKEVLRVRPALTIAPRLLLEPVRIAGHTIPAGVQVAACLWLAMRREDLWPDAGAFRPERWLDGSAAKPTSWIPYGGGVRRCAGAPFAEMEMREVLRAAAALNFRPARTAPERARRSMLVVVPERGGELVVD